jgi:hypothetical protein
MIILTLHFAIFNLFAPLKGDHLMAMRNCGKCWFRAKYDDNPGSLIGRLWKWHTNWCPGWKSYLGSLPENEKNRILEKYGTRKP